MATITFVYPDFESLGIEYLMAICRREGHQVGFEFYLAEDAYLGKKSGSIPFNAIAQRIVAGRPDMVGFSCVTDNYQYQLACARAVKALAPDVVVLFGGIHPTAEPRRVLEEPAVDAIAIGEADRSLPVLLERCGATGQFCLPAEPLQGIVFKKDGELIGAFDEGPLVELDQLPFPHKEPFLAQLKDAAHEYRTMTSRGCPYSCSYCFNSHFHKLRGRKIIRQRTVDSVLAELAWARARYPVKYIMFVDDSFTTNKKWVQEFCGRYRQEIGLPFACVANPHYITEEVAAELSRAGCINVQIGIQSLSEELCAGVLNRKSSNAVVARAITAFKKNGVMVQVDHMLGIPGDSIEIQERSVAFYNTCRPNLISIFWLTYYPQTKITDIAREQGLLSDADMDSIAAGIGLTGASYLTGGSMKDPRAFFCVSLLLNYLPILPRPLVTLLLKTRLYRLLGIKSFFISTALPRVIQSLFNRRDFRGRSHMLRFIGKLFGAKSET
ncbi:B12-binding domain-containing radical SAM protein [Thermodesulfobacteriota bacterium]